MTVFFDGVMLLQPGRGVVGQSIVMEDQIIVAIDPPEHDADWQRTDGGGRLVTPGLIDLHTHGWGHDSFDTASDLLPLIVKALRTRGVTSLLATVVPSPDPTCLDRLEGLAKVIGESGLDAQVGLHLEGPFVAVAGAACRSLPVDVGLLEELVAACGGRLRAMTLAPDTEGIIPVIEWLCEHDVSVFISHTQADFEQTELAIDAGARHATHFYDVFSSPEATDGGVRPAGAVEAILADPRCTVDFIPDGVHVHPGVIRMALAAKGWQGVSMITDANIGAGLGQGEYPTPWGFPIRVGPRGGARNADPDHPKFERLAGSVLSMDQGINHLLDWLDLPPQQTWAMATLNPANVVGLRQKGRLDIGADADLVLWDQSDGRFVPAQSWIAGRCVWKNDSINDPNEKEEQP